MIEPDIKHRMRRMRGQGYSWERIARDFKVDLRDVVNELGVTIRRRGRPNADVCPECGALPCHQRKSER